MPRRSRRALAAFGILAVAGAGAYGALWPLRLAGDWRLIDTIRLPRPDSLAVDAGGRLRYVTTQTRPGRLLERTVAGRQVVFGDFGEPDGLLLGPATVVVTEEEDDGRVMEYDLANATVRVLGRMNSPEGVLRRADGSLLVAQDQPQGHLWLLREGAAPVALGDGLDRPEGLCTLPDGRIGIAESGRGRILAWGPAGLQTLAGDLDGIDQLACGADGSLWAVISQNRSGELVRIKDGRRQVIARHLRQPQGIALAPDGGLYLAETGADRVLHLMPR
jgi:sugar lactone lactonase YvrE